MPEFLHPHFIIKLLRKRNAQVKTYQGVAFSVEVHFLPVKVIRVIVQVDFWVTFYKFFMMAFLIGMSCEIAP